jgi:hypothetical protein
MEVPSELRNLDQWICWKLQDGSRKVPVDARTGKNAKSNDPATWSSFDKAQQFLTEHHELEGLGFVFARDGGVFGIDLDGCRNPETGELANWATEILSDFNTYAEVSPSGTGVKIYGRGSLASETGKKKSLDVEKLSNKQPAIEAYDFGRYFAFTGELVDFAPLAVNNCQAALDVLCKKLWGSAQPKQVNQSIPLQPDNKTKRAWAYLSRIEPAISGQAGHNVTFRAACKLVVGFDLRPEEAFPLLQSWNQTCSPPWSDRDLWHKLMQADKAAGTRGFLLNESQQYDGPEVDLRALLAPKPLEEIKVTATPKHEFPVECLKAEGLLGEIVRYNLETAYYPQPELALAGAIALLATITGRRVEALHGVRTNLYVLGLAPSGSGKEYARKINKNILAAAVGLDMLGPERIGSHAGLIGCMDRNPVQLFQLDEIGRMIETMQDPRKAPHLFNIGGVLMQLYSSADAVWTGDALADAKKIKTIVQPHCVVYGTSVPDKFWGSLTLDNVSEGLLGRFIVFESKLGYSLPQAPEKKPLPDSIIEQVRNWISPPREWFGANAGNLATALPTVRQIECSQEAQERLQQHAHAIAVKRMGESGIRPSVWSRTAEKAQKLALIHACSRATLQTARIDTIDAEWGVRLANYLTREMISHADGNISSSDHEKQLKWVSRMIKSAGSDGLTRSQLTRKTQSIRSKYRDEIVAQLIESGSVVQQDKGTTAAGGRPLTVYVFSNVET